MPLIIYRKDYVFIKKKIKNSQEFTEKLNSDKITIILLFGSVACGEDSKDSDIDILVVSDYWEEIDSEITELVGNIMYNNYELISAHIMNTKKFENTKHYSFLSNVLKEGIILV